MFIAENGIRTLLDDLGRARSGGFCVHISFSGRVPPRKVALYECIGAAFPGPDGTVYACEDGDVFIVMRNVTRQNLDHLMACLGELSQNPRTDLGDVDLYDVGQEQDLLLWLVRNKAARIDDQQQRQAELDAAFEAKRSRRNEG